MSSKNRMMSLILLSTLVSGCAIKNYNYGTAIPAVSAPADGQATVYIVRPGIYGFAIRYPITINGKAYPSLRASRYIEAMLEPGPVEVKAKGEKMCTVTFDAQADHAYYLHATNKSGWLYARVQLEGVEPAQGVAYIASCSATTE